MNADFGKFKIARRKAVNLSAEALVKTDYLHAGQTFPLVLRPALADVNLISWAADNRAFIETQLLGHGAILFRDFKVETVDEFEQFARSISGELLGYRERAAPRVEVGKNIYTSTEYPADHPIPLHHEMSYSHNWPTKIWFFCVQPPAERGATPIADDRKVFQLLRPEIKEKFMRKKVMYTRNYGEGVDLTWQEAFQTTDREVVEAYCRRSYTEFRWKDENRLHTRQTRQAVATHPALGQTVWFNHAHMFHISNLEAAVREALLAEFSEDELPRNAYYGDGSPLEDAVLDEIREVYREASVTFPWQKGDILMLDNFLASHGREPFKGPRKIVVAMSELYTNPDIEKLSVG